MAAPTLPPVDVHVRELRAFVAVAEELHFTRAAERLFVTQPSLSRQVAALERAVRTPLLHRDARAVTLTAAGRALLPGAREAVEAWERAQRDVAAEAAREAAALTVGLATGVGRGLLAAVARHLRVARPDATLAMRQVTWDDPTAGLGDRSTDVAFAFLPLPASAGLAWRVLFTEPRQVALPADHRLAARGRLALADLRDEPFLALPAPPGRAFWLAADERDGHPPVVAGEVRTAEEAFEAVAGGVGVALVAEGNGRLYRRDGVVVRDVDGLAPAELVVAWRADDQRATVAAFVAACAAAARETPSSGA
jgi:DNA-binding transcriptional LysR family regulator